MTTAPESAGGTPRHLTSTGGRRGVRGVPWPDARRRARTAASPLAARRLPLPEACGSPLVADLLALTDLPVADLSAMDGWAVSGPPPWRIVADLPAGRMPNEPLASGECAGIATGAVVPDGADAVLPVELSLRGAAGVRPVDVTAASAPRSHIRRAGE